MPAPGAWQGNFNSTLPQLYQPHQLQQNPVNTPFQYNQGTTPNFSNMGPLNYSDFTSPVGENDASGQMMKELQAQWMSGQISYQQLMNNWRQFNMQFGASEDQRAIDNYQAQLNDYNSTALSFAQQQLAENNASAAYNQWANQFSEQQQLNQTQADQWQQQFGFNQSQATTEANQWQQQFGLNQAESEREGQQWQQQFGFNQSQADREANQWEQQFGFTQSEADRDANQWQQQFDYTAGVDKAQLQQAERFRKYEAFGRAAQPSRSSWSGGGFR